jgi:hypothetical protein
VSAIKTLAAGLTKELRTTLRALRDRHSLRRPDQLSESICCLASSKGLRFSYSGLIGNPPRFLALTLRNRGNGGPQMQRQERRSPHAEPMRCDQCRKSFGLILHRYFRMRFCSADCLSAYQRRLADLTLIKIRSLERPRALPR